VLWQPRSISVKLGCVVAGVCFIFLSIASTRFPIIRMLRICCSSGGVDFGPRFAKIVHLQVGNERIIIEMHHLLLRYAVVKGMQM
jgi:hypothetical protein